MSLAPPAREILFPLFAFNVEVSRAPWVTEEPMIAEMRLQWWRDALDEIGQGGQPRAHEVVTPLAKVLAGQEVADLDALVAARRWDIYKDSFEDAAHFESYLDATSGGLYRTAARIMGSSRIEEVSRVARAAGLANLFRAVPELEARGRKPLIDGRAKAVGELARAALSDLSAAEARLDGAGRAALRPAWQSAAVLRQVAKAPGRVAAGAIALNPLSDRLALASRALRGR